MGKQLALDPERQVRPRRATAAPRLTMVGLGKLFDWKEALIWTFARNQAQAMLACDFFVSVTVRFQVIYVFVIMEVGSRRLIHFNVTSPPTAAWTLQQFREALDND